MSGSDSNTEITQSQTNAQPADVVSESVQMVQTDWRAPMPRPQDLRQYEETLEGAANRILELTENEQAHRHNLENKTLELQMSEIEIARTSIESESKRANWGVWLAFSIAMTDWWVEYTSRQPIDGR